jgi:hypothetical protein
LQFWSLVDLSEIRLELLRRDALVTANPLGDLLVEVDVPALVAAMRLFIRGASDEARVTVLARQLRFRLGECFAGGENTLLAQAEGAPIGSGTGNLGDQERDQQAGEHPAPLPRWTGAG